MEIDFLTFFFRPPFGELYICRVRAIRGKTVFAETSYSYFADSFSPVKYDAMIEDFGRGREGDLGITFLMGEVDIGCRMDSRDVEKGAVWSVKRN